MYFHPGLGDGGGVAVEFEPEVLNLRVSKGLENTAVELVAGGVGYATGRRVSGLYDGSTDHTHGVLTMDMSSPRQISTNLPFSPRISSRVPGRVRYQHLLSKEPRRMHQYSFHQRYR